MARKKPVTKAEGGPLSVRKNGQLARKHKGQTYYFGVVADPQAALEEHDAKWPLIVAGLDSDALESDGPVLVEVTNSFLDTKTLARDTGELAERTYRDYKVTCARLLKQWGQHAPVAALDSSAFFQLKKNLAKTLGPRTLGNEIRQVRMIFKHAYDVGLIDRPLRMGPDFKVPGKRILRRHDRAKGEKLFTPDELHQLIGSADPTMRAIILLGINCGFEPHDCGLLEMRYLDLDSGWHRFPRPKTETDRRCPLWPITVAALSMAIAARKTVVQKHDRVFVGRFGGGLEGVPKSTPISQRLRKLRDRTLPGHPGTFLWLRHTFATVGADTPSQSAHLAVDHIMGHLGHDMASVYRERIFDERLLAVSSHVERWLFG